MGRRLMMASAAQEAHEFEFAALRRDEQEERKRAQKDRERERRDQRKALRSAGKTKKGD